VHGAELAQLAEDFSQNHGDLPNATLLDLTFACRLLYGRWPTQPEIQQFQSMSTERSVDGLLADLVKSQEFQNRKLAIEFERPAHDCIVMTETHDHLRFFFSVRDTFVGFPIAVGVFETDVQEALQRLLRSGMNCIDVGANLGYYSIRFAAAAGEAGHVYSFEPDAFSFALLRKNTAENRKEKIISIYNVACGDKDGEVTLCRDANPANYGGMFVRDAGTDAREAAATTVPVKRLDSVIPPGVRIDLVKLDVEGYEPFVLRGMRRIQRESSPILLCEFNTRALQSHGSDVPEQFLAELRGLGYSVYEALAFSKANAPPFEYRAGTSCFANLVCIPSTSG
jgi:FkbM family methyltransferase